MDTGLSYFHHEGCMRVVVGLLCMLVLLRGLVSTHLTDACLDICTLVWACGTSTKPKLRGLGQGNSLAIVWAAVNINVHNQKLAATIHQAQIKIVIFIGSHWLHTLHCIVGILHRDVNAPVSRCRVPAPQGLRVVVLSSANHHTSRPRKRYHHNDYMEASCAWHAAQRAP